MAGTILESFFTTLGFEVDEAGLQSATEKVGQLGKSLMSLGVFSSLSIAGIAAMTLSVNESMAQVELLSERTGLATDTIAGMAKAGMQFDISAQAMGGGLEYVNGQLGLIAQNAPTKMKRVMDAFGLTAKNAQGKTKDVMTFLGDLADKVQSIEAKGGNAQGLITRLGLDPNMILMLRNGKEAFMDLYQTAKGGIPWKAGDYERAKEFTENWRKAKAALTGVWQSIVVGLTPALNKFIGDFNEWWKAYGRGVMEGLRREAERFGQALEELDAKFRKMTGGISLVAAALTAMSFAIVAVVGSTLISWISSSLTPLASMASALGKVATGMLGLAGAMDTEAASATAADAATGPFLLVGLAIVAMLAILAVMIAFIVEDFRLWRRHSDSLIGSFERKFPGAFEAIRKGVRMIKEEFNAMMEQLRKAWPTIKPFLVGALKGFILLTIAQFLLLGALLLMMGVALYVFLFLMKWLIKIANYFQTILPTDKLKTKWQKFKEYMAKELVTMLALFIGFAELVAAGWQQIVDGFHSIVNGLKAIWNRVTAYFGGKFDELKAMWGALAGFVIGVWQGMADVVMRIWDDLTGAIGKKFDSIRKSLTFIASSKTDASVSTPWHWSGGAPGGPGMAALMGAPVAPAMPGMFTTNAQRSQSITNNNEMRNTFNITAPDPATAGDMVNDKMGKAFPQLMTRYASGNHL